MTLLQPGMLALLPAVALPVVIHLLNRLRYRSVSWAAMAFLQAASRHSTRRARLRQILVLACRTLALFGLLGAALRPLAGGWLGRLSAAPPAVVVVLLDRSPSMEARLPLLGISKREWMLEAIERMPREAYRGTRFVLLESAGLTPMPLPGLDGTRDLDAVQPTETAGNGPAMIQAALDLLEADNTGRAEIWILTDLQQSAWRPSSARWTELSARLSTLAGGVRIRVLALPDPPGVNASLTLRETGTGRVDGRPRRWLDLAVRRTESLPETISVTWERDGQRTPFDVTVRGGETRIRRMIEPADDGGAPWTWGRFLLPADEQPSDNTAWYAFGPEPPLRARVAADDPVSASVFLRALAPDPRFGRWAEPMPFSGRIPMDADDGLVVWQGALPTGDDAEPLLAFVREGGVVLFAPPAGGSPSPEEARARWGLQWGEIERAGVDAWFRVEVWEDPEGPLARTSDGLSLPVGEVRMQARRAASLDPEAGWRVLAADRAGRFFLARRPEGAGSVYAVCTLPAADWSNLADGVVLLPMLQRMLAQGSVRAASVVHAECGVWRPDPGETAIAVDSGAPVSRPLRAGVYRSGDRMIVLHRPAAEDDEERLDAGSFAALLPGVSVEVMDVTRDAGGAQPSEMAPLLLAAALLFLAAEGMLLLAGHAPTGPVRTRRTA